MFHYVLHVLTDEKSQIIGHLWLHIDAKHVAEKLSTPNHPCVAWSAQQYFEPGTVILTKEL